MGPSRPASTITAVGRRNGDGAGNGNGHLGIGGSAIPPPLAIADRLGTANGNGRHRSRGNGYRARLGVVDYTLAKRSILRDARRGLLSLTDICDAHPELLRAARHVGEQASRQCPVCERDDLRLLAYVYADELKRDNGRVWAIDKALAITASCRNGTCYIVEVCTRCSWNHLAEALVGRTAG
jgi:hypothetical protein